MVRMFVVLNSLLLLARGRTATTLMQSSGRIRPPARVDVTYPLLKRVELGTSVETKPHIDRNGSTRRVGETHNRGRFRADEERESTWVVQGGQDRFVPARMKEIRANETLAHAYQRSAASYDCL